MIRKTFLCLLLCLALLGAGVLNPSPAQASSDLLGVWERYGDTWAGTRIEVKQGQNNLLYGELITVRGGGSEYGFQAGEIKWKDITQYNANTYSTLDLFKCPNVGPKYYAMYIIQNDGILKIVNKKGELYSTWKAIY